MQAESAVERHHGASRRDVQQRGKKRTRQRTRAGDGEVAPMLARCLERGLGERAAGQRDRSEEDRGKDPQPGPTGQDNGGGGGGEHQPPGFAPGGLRYLAQQRGAVGRGRPVARNELDQSGVHHPHAQRRERQENAVEAVIGGGYQLGDNLYPDQAARQTEGLGQHDRQQARRGISGGEPGELHAAVVRFSSLEGGSLPRPGPSTRSRPCACRNGSFG